MKIDYAFIVHSRERRDIYRKYPILKYVPFFVVDYLTENLPPIIVSKITGLVDNNGKNKLGIIIGIPMTAKQMLEKRNKALKKIIQSVQLAKRHGAKIVALGAMTSSLSSSGLEVINSVKDVVVTNGRTYTSLNIVSYILYCINYFKYDIESIKIAIVGAAGGIGRGVTELLIKEGIKNLILIDLERKLENVKEHICRSCDNCENQYSIDIDHKLEALRGAKIIIAATSSPEIVIKSKDVDSGTIIINDAQPSDIDPDILINRNDVLVIEGGVVRTANIICHFDLGLYNKNDIYSCLAEAVLLSYSNIENEHFVDLNEKTEKKLRSYSRELNFKIAGFQNSLGYLSTEFLNQFMSK